MYGSFSYLWRLARTVFSAAVFAVAVPLLAAVALPLARWRSQSTEGRQLQMQRAAHHGSRLYLRFVERLGILHLEGHRTERLSEPGQQLVVANHPTLLDVLVLLAFMPEADCVVSGNRARNWLLRGMVSACGYISNDSIINSRTDHSSNDNHNNVGSAARGKSRRLGHGAAVVDECARRLRAGRSLIIFPEGTRSPEGGLHPLRRGAAHIAMAAECELLPVVIRCDPATLGKNEKWYDVPNRAFTVTVTVIDPISPGPVLESGVGLPLAARRLTGQLREALAKGLDIADVGNA